MGNKRMQDFKTAIFKTRILYELSPETFERLKFKNL